MINVSNKFFQTMEKRRNFTGYADVTLADGSVLTLTENEFTLNNNSITESAGSTGLPLGEAICRTVQIEIINPNDRYSDYDFVGAKIDLELRFWLDGETESFNIGEFTVIDPHTYGETIIITAVDDMYKAEEYYSTKMEFPATIGAVLADVCSTCGIALKTTSFINDGYLIEHRPPGNYIVRNLIGYIAMIAGGNARINRDNELEIISYDFSALEDIAVIGGTFNPWTGGDTLSGGTLNPWTSGDELSGGDLIGKTDYHLLRNFKTLKVDTDEIEITGISMRVENDMGVQNLISGTEGYVINVENPLLRDREEEGLALIASVLVGGKMRRFEGDHIAYPLAEFMDSCVVVDKKGNMYPTILTDIDFKFFGYTNFKNTAQSKEEIKPKKSTKFRDELVRIEQKAEDLVEAEKTAREEAIKNLNITLGDSSGLYVSDVEQTDGSTIRYLHDQPALVDSKNVIKITADAIGFSKDGGATYPYGLTLNGETITKYLYAEGIDADYITAGKISDSTGQNYWDLEKGELVIKTATIDGSLISVTVTADQLTTGRIQDATGSNYWDLDSGKIKITDAEIDGATINNISATDITAGTITDKKGNNYWNLETGEMVITKATIDSELIAVRITADQLTTGRITDSTGSNYWDLDTGEMKITKATIDSDLIAVEVTADNITTGRIEDKKGNNYWDLDSGEMVIKKATIDSALLKNIDADNITAGRISDGTSGNYWDLDSGTLVINKATINSSLISVDITADDITTGRITSKTGGNYWDLDTGELVIKKATIDSSLISVSITADEITTGRITDSTGDNYWDLDTGKMVITDATIDSALLKNIDADNITAGRITSKTGGNYWDLDTGDMVIKKATIDSALLKNIDADNITTGRITAKSGNNYWDLDTGALVINNATINTSLDADKITTGKISDKSGDSYWDLDNGDSCFKGQIICKDKITFINENAYNGNVTTGDIEMSKALFTYKTYSFVKNSSGEYVLDTSDSTTTNEQPCMVIDSGYGLSVGDLKVNGVYTDSVQYENAYGKTLKGENITACNLATYNNLKVDGKEMTDFVIEQKTSGVWTYEKWNSGKLKIWGNIPINNMTIDTPLGTWYRSADGVISSIEQAYPVSFTNVPVVSGTFVSSNSASAMLWCSKSSESRMKTYSPGYYLIRPDTKTGVTGYISVIAKGKWK